MKRDDYFVLIATICMAVAVFITLGDVVGRLFSRPIPGAFAICQMACLVMVFLTLAYTQSVKGHVDVDLVFNRFPPKAQSFLDIVSSLCGLFIVIVLAWGTMHLISDSLASGEYISAIHIPLFPFHLIMFIGTLFLGYQLVRDLSGNLRRIVRRYHRGDLS